ncbi:MAG: Wzz/FepE/Etk N-terminal domain-containing protein [Arcobacteraceae bacterium]|nr:Wzz/FepE/Etk N-terminal domain-containing protein [Arcobacteraceae bacterium]
MNTTRNNIQEDEIDLKEIFKTIWAKRVFIVGFTLLVTLVSAIYVMLKTPVFEARALIEIGDYKLDNNHNNKVIIDNASQLEKKLSTIFIDMKKDSIEKEFVISSISVPKGMTSFFEIKAEAISNENAIKGIHEVVAFIQEEHQNILNDVKMRREFELKNIDFQILDIKEKKVSLIDKKMDLHNQNLIDLEKQLNLIDENLRNIQSLNPSLAALKLMEKRDISSSIISITTQLYDMENQKNELLTTIIYKLEENKRIIETLLAPHNYKNTQIVGNIITNTNPTKPKKSLIVVVAFVTGFILSIFLVFFIQFIQSFKEEK